MKKIASLEPLIKFFILIVMIFVNGCAIIPKSEETTKKELLQNHLKSWENIRIDGIIEINYKAFSFRKNILIRKNEQAIRIDIFDTGIMGLKPQPFLTAYYDSSLTINSSAKIKIGDFQLPSISEIFDIIKYEDEILSRKKIEFPNYKITFSNDLKIKQLNFLKDIHVDFIYAKDLQLLELIKEKKILARIQIDKISHQKVKFNKL